MPLPLFFLVAVFWLCFSEAALHAQSLRLPVPEFTLLASDLNRGVPLNTQWHFTGPDGSEYLVPVPNRWEKTYGQILPRFGQGVYRLTLQLPPEGVGQNLKFYNELIAGTTFRLYVNEKLVGYNGLYLGSSSRISQFSVFEAQQEKMHIRLEVNNQTLHWSGLVRPLWLGYNDTISHKDHRRTLEFNIFFGAFFFLALFHMVLYLFFPQDRSALWFGLMTFSSVVYMEFFRMHNLEYLLGDIPLEWNIRGLRLGLYWILPCFFWYVQSLAPDKVSPGGPWFLTGLALVFSLSLVLPGQIHSYVMLLWFMLMILGVFYQMALGWRLRHHENLWFFYLSGLIFLMFIVHDILSVMNAISTGLIVRYGFLVFCTAQTAFVAWRAQQNHKQSVQFNADLKKVNANLEQLVQQRTEEIAEKNKSLNHLMAFKQEMVEMLVHDLKTPLNVLLNLPEAEQENDASIQQASLRIKNLVEHMLDVQDQSELQLQLKKVSLSDLVAQVTGVMQGWANSKQVQLVNLVPRDCRVEVDVFFFSRVIQNLLDNAIKASPPHAEITLRAHEQGKAICFCIADQGAGMPPEVQERVKDKYVSLHQSSENLSSSGLGLYLCEQVVHAHRGRLEIQSQPDQGTQIFIYLPCPAQTRVLSWHWTAEQKQALAPSVQQLEAIDVFEVSALQPVFKQLETLGDPQIQAWTLALKESVKSIDESKYRSLINQVA